MVNCPKCNNPMRKQEVYSAGGDEVWWCDQCKCQSFSHDGTITETEQKE